MRLFRLCALDEKGALFLRPHLQESVDEGVRSLQDAWSHPAQIFQSKLGERRSSSVPKAILYTKGAIWMALVRGGHAHEIHLFVEGFPPVRPSQPVELILNTPNEELVVRGVVQRVLKSRMTIEHDGALPSTRVEVAVTDCNALIHWSFQWSLANWGRSIKDSGITGNLFATLPSHDTGEMLVELSQVGFLAPQGPALESLCLPVSPLRFSLGEIRQPVPTPLAEDEPENHFELLSTTIECRNALGQRIVGYHDRPRNPLPPGAPVVILAPGYGETKREYIALAYFLASNGFHVVRYDHTHHVGESEGVHELTTLSGMKHDMGAMLEFVNTSWPGSPTALAATSLAGRVALKLLVDRSDLSLLLVIMPVVDLRATLQAVHQEDLIEEYRRGKGKGLTNVLGFNVDGRTFLSDAVKGEFADLSSTLNDTVSIRTPVTVFMAEQDVWVQPQAVHRVFFAISPFLRHGFMVPEALHRLSENPKKARAVYRHVVKACQRHMLTNLPPGELIEPRRRDIGRQNRIERERIQSGRFKNKADHLAFWRDYLGHFHYIVNSYDYLTTLDHMYRLLLPLPGGGTILDAGCGNGHFGVFLARHTLSRHSTPAQNLAPPLHYVGIDFVHRALSDAQDRLRRFLASQPTDHPLGGFHSSFYQVDLNQPLPFPDGQFERIVSNLVVGYLRDPGLAIRELLRVLKPGGRLVVTNLKPCADLTQIYRNYVQHTQVPLEIEEARHVLNNSGRIKQGESEGTFRFYSQEEFHRLLVLWGAPHLQLFSTFGNQAYLAVVEKPPLKTPLLPIAL